MDDSKKRINWLPGHMTKAIENITSQLKMVDIVLEIRDARSPIVTGNNSLNRQLRDKSRLIVLNKTNLADPNIVKLWTKWFSKQCEPFVFINCFESHSLKQIIKMTKDIVNKKRLKSNPTCTEKSKFKLMIVGLPNTGKSTIINRLAKKNATKVADVPGKTKHQLWVNVSSDLAILDTPGVLPPSVESDEHGLWLSALYTIPDKIMEVENTACFIIEHLLRIESSVFKKHYKLESFDLDIVKTLDQIAKLRGCIRKKNEYDYERVYTIILNDFRSGKLGPISFGHPPISK